MDGVEQPDEAQQMSAEERLAAQAKEIQDLREQFARVAVKEGPRLPPPSVPEINLLREAPIGAMDAADALEHQGVRTA